MWWTNPRGVVEHLAKLLGRDEYEMEARLDVESRTMRVKTIPEVKPFTDVEKEAIKNSFYLWMVAPIYEVEIL